MKTLRQFYDGLSGVARTWIDKNCLDWFDKNEPDYYRKYKPIHENITDVKFDTKYRKSGSYSWYSMDDQCRDLEALWVDSLIQRRDNGIISDHDVAEALLSYYMGNENVGKKLSYMDRRIFLACKDKKNQEKVYRQYLTDEFESLPLHASLFFVNDFDNIEKDATVISSKQLAKLDRMEFTTVFEIFGDNMLRKLAIENPEGFAKQLRNFSYHGKTAEANDINGVIYRKMNAIFDEMFFLSSSVWSDKDKQDVIEERFGNCEFTDNALRYFEEFARDVLSVDHQYSRYIFALVRTCPALGNYIYDAKKPETEINENTPVEMTFRYSKDIRKLGKIANICVRESLSKANNSFLKGIGSLIRLYGYDFNTIYDAMYPDEVGAVIVK